MLHPLLLLTLGFAAGISVAEIFEFPPLAAGSSALLCFLAGAWLLRRRGMFPRWLIFFLGVGGGAFWMAVMGGSLAEVPYFLHGRHLEVTGELTDGGRRYSNREVYSLKVKSARYQPGSFNGAQNSQMPAAWEKETEWLAGKKVLLVIYEEGDASALAEDAKAAQQEAERNAAQSQEKLRGGGENERRSFRYGDTVAVKGELLVPRAAGNPGEFDYQKYLWRQGIAFELAASGREAKVISRGGGCFLWRWVQEARDYLEGFVSSSLPFKQQALLQAVLLGDRSELPAEDLARYQRVGIVHAFSVSGLHIGFVLALALQAARWLRLRKAASFILAAGMMFFYAGMAGFPAAALRAAIMAALALAAWLWGRKGSPFYGLVAAAFLLLLLNPQWLFDAGFQLSFGAAWGLTYLYPWLTARCSQWPLPLRWLLLPLAAQLGILPITAYYFNQISLLSLLANAVLAGVLGAVVILGAAAFMLAPLLPPLAVALLWGAGAGAAAAEQASVWFDALPGGVLNVAAPSLVLIAVYYAALAAARAGWLGYWLRTGARWAGYRFCFVLRSRWSLAFLGVFSLLVFFAALGGRLPGRESVFSGVCPANRKLEIVFLDVGQGDCILVKTPDGRHLLVDAGGRNPMAAGEGAGEENGYEPGRDTVVPYLRHRGVSRLDAVINTHPHRDHLGGLAAVLEEIPAGTVLLPPAGALTPEEAGDLAKLQHLCTARGIPWQEVRGGMFLAWDSPVRAEIIHPDVLLTGTRSDANNNSLVLRLSYGHFSCLLPGDIEREGIEALLASGRELRSQVMKLPHHGSRYSLEPALAERVRPQTAVVSVGRNSFGHPDREVLDFWQQNGVSLYRTDRQGAITVKSDGEGYSIEPYLSPWRRPW